MADSSKSWYTKYRPATLADYCGDEIKSKVMKRFKNRDELPHTIMIDGPRGTGKTTIARILTKNYLCENPDENGMPCECCTSCLNINENLITGETDDVDVDGVSEIDATQMRGVSEIEEILEEAKQQPVYSDYKILIIDECHMISKTGQNALLKVIEDIPKHLIVIFATTNPEDVLTTIKSRMQLRLKAQKQNVADMVHRLEQISQYENLTISKEALEAIAIAGDRVPRECINILEDIAISNDRNVTIETVRNSIGTNNSSTYIEYITAANTSLSDTLVFVKNLVLDEPKLEKFVKGLSKFIMDAAYIKHGISLDEFPVEYVKAVRLLFDVYTTNDFDMLFQAVDDLTRNIRAYDIENSGRNALMLTMLAVRISKISLLANGLYGEQTKAVEENQMSLLEHQNKLRTDPTVALEKMRKELDLNDMREEFTDLTVMENTDDITAKLHVKDVGLVKMEEEKKEVTESKDTERSEIDDFFDNM